MFAEELTKIKESEAKADQLQKQAKIEAKKMLENAGAEAEKLISEAEDSARTVYDAAIAEGQQLSDREYEAFLEATEKQCREMEGQAAKNENKAVDMIAERIVSVSVNR